MPTTVIKTIGSGGDYADFNAAATAMPTDLVAADQVWRLRVLAGGVSIASAQSITGKTTDATRFIVIEANTGASFTENASKLTNALAFNTANGAYIDIPNSVANYGLALNFGSVALFQGLQVRKATGGGAPGAVIQVGGPIKNCVIDAPTTSYNQELVQCTAFINSLLLKRGDDGYVQDLIGTRFANGVPIVGSTIISLAGSTARLVAGSGSAPTVANCALFGVTALTSNSGWSLSASNCATNLASLAGTANIVSLTATNQFVSATTDFRVKSGAALIGAGTRDAANTGDLDIVNSARSTTAPTIGAWEYAASTSAVTSDLTASFVISSSLTSVASDLAASFQIQSAVVSSLAAAFTILANASVTVPIVNNTNTSQAAITIPHVVVNRVSDRTQLLSLASQTTDGSGNLSITGLTSGTLVAVSGWNADGSSMFVWSGTAA